MPLSQLQENRTRALLSKAAFRLLLIEFLPQNTTPIAVSLAKNSDISFDIIHVDSLEDAIECTDVVSFDALIWRLPHTEWHTMEGISSFTNLRPNIPLILLTDAVNQEFAKESLRHGAHDCISLGQCDNTRIAHTIVHAIESKRAQGTVYSEHDMTDSDNWKNLAMELIKMRNELNDEEILSY